MKFTIKGLILNSLFCSGGFILGMLVETSSGVTKSLCNSCDPSLLQSTPARDVEVAGVIPTQNLTIESVDRIAVDSAVGEAFKGSLSAAQERLQLSAFLDQFNFTYPSDEERNHLAKIFSDPKRASLLVDSMIGRILEGESIDYVEEVLNELRSSPSNEAVDLALHFEALHDSSLEEARALGYKVLMFAPDSFNEETVRRIIDETYVERSEEVVSSMLSYLASVNTDSEYVSENLAMRARDLALHHQSPRIRAQALELNVFNTGYGSSDILQTALADQENNEVKLEALRIISTHSGLSQQSWVEPVVRQIANDTTADPYLRQAALLALTASNANMADYTDDEM